MHLERYKVDDLLLIKPRAGLQYPGFEAALATENGMGLTAWVGNTPVGAAGIIRWPLVHEGWVYISDWMAARPLVFHRLVKVHLLPFARYMRTRELVARVEPGLPKFAQWPLALGMSWAGYDEDGNLQFRRYF